MTFNGLLIAKYSATAKSSISHYDYLCNRMTSAKVVSINFISQRTSMDQRDM